MTIPTNNRPLIAIAIEGDVLLTSFGPGAPVTASFTPEAILASLDGLRRAAESAIINREWGVTTMEDDDHGAHRAR